MKTLTIENNKAWKKLVRKRKNYLTMLIRDGWLYSMLMWVSMVINPVILIYLISQFALPDTSEEIMRITPAVAGTLISVFFLLKYKRLSRPIIYQGGVIKANESIEAKVKQFTAETFRCLGVNADTVSVYIDSEYNDNRIKVVKDKKNYCLVISPSLFTLIIKKSATAKAILIHEIAHVQQRDCALWPKALYYNELNYKFIIPMYLSFSLIVFTLPIQARYEIFPGLKIGLAGQYLLLAALLILQWLNLRQIRRTSERIADLAVVLFGEGRALGCLLHPLLKKKKFPNPFSVHPSASRRYKLTSKFYKKIMREELNPQLLEDSDYHAVHSINLEQLRMRPSDYLRAIAWMIGRLIGLFIISIIVLFVIIKIYVG